MNYLFLGDTHGDLDFVARAADIAAEHDAEIIQVGDWGFIWTYQGKVVDQVKQLSIELERAGEKYAKPPVTMRFIDGNHDHHPELRRLSGNKRSPVNLAHNVIYQPRGSTYVDPDGTKFLFLGGAPSIDKHMRTEGRSWWSEETITEEDMKWVGLTGWADVLVTHDAPTYPPGFMPKGDPDFRIQSALSMSYISDALKQSKAKLHVHGHWHYRYTADNTIGLASNINRFPDSYILWNINDGLLY